MRTMRARSPHLINHSSHNLVPNRLEPLTKKNGPKGAKITTFRHLRATFLLPHIKYLFLIITSLHFFIELRRIRSPSSRKIAIFIATKCHHPLTFYFITPPLFT